MGTGSAVKTDLYHLHNYTQNSGVAYIKDLFVENLREYFNADSYYHYQRDVWGYPKVDDHTDMLPTAGLNDHSTTRLFIGEKFRHSATGIFYPALLVSDGGIRYVPISMSRDKGTIQYQNVKVVDGYGNERIITTPLAFIQDGAWEGSVNIDILAKDSVRARDELTDLIMIAFTDFLYEEMPKSGVAILKGPSAGSPSESDDRNGKLFRRTISCDVRGEWRREIPISNIIEIIQICVDFQYLSNNQPVSSPALAIETTVDLVDQILNS